MNAQLQCAFHIPYVRHIATNLLEEDRQFLDDPDADKGDNTKTSSNQRKQIPSEAAIALKELLDGMVKSAEEKSPAYSPRAFCIRLGIPPMVQQDSQEFWKLLLPAVGSEKLSDLYKGVYEDYISALDGSGIERRSDEIFLDLSLDVLKRCVAILLHFGRSSTSSARIIVYSNYLYLLLDFSPLFFQ
jgi:hypothetical protein